MAHFRRCCLRMSSYISYGKLRECIYDMLLIFCEYSNIHEFTSSNFQGKLSERVLKSFSLDLTIFHFLALDDNSGPHTCIIQSATKYRSEGADGNNYIYIILFQEKI